MWSILNVNCKNKRNNITDVFLVFLLLTLNITRVITGESHIDFCTHCVIMTHGPWPWSPHSLLFASFPDFWQNRWFFKKILNVLMIKKANWIFEELSNLCLIGLLISFFPLLLWITTANRTKLQKVFIELQNQAERNTTNIQTGLIHQQLQ